MSFDRTGDVRFELDALDEAHADARVRPATAKGAFRIARALTRCEATAPEP